MHHALEIANLVQTSPPHHILSLTLYNHGVQNFDDIFETQKAYYIHICVSQNTLIFYSKVLSIISHPWFLKTLRKEKVTQVKRKTRDI